MQSYYEVVRYHRPVNNFQYICDFVDASEYCVWGCLSHISEEGFQKPVAFASCKLIQT